MTTDRGGQVNLYLHTTIVTPTDYLVSICWTLAIDSIAVLTLIACYKYGPTALYYLDRWKESRRS